MCVMDVVVKDVITVTMVGVVMAPTVKNVNDQENQLMAKVKKSLLGNVFIESTPKKTQQGSGKHTKYSAKSNSRAKKRYRGQGR